MKKKLLFIVCLLLSQSISLLANERKTINLSGKGWFLWQDKEADWKNEIPN